ncbi:MAG: hypothetical protein CMM58_02015 [Rhodospirillaceae bacterium]|nr:hypothetical protein [Rhodospirillaceae bacterium]|tara:strand:- start:474 stop:746 length:273 start_codon:yes stop_codon:yes gene_type:complete
MNNKRPIKQNWVAANIIWICVVAFKLASIAWICVVGGMLISEVFFYYPSSGGFNLGRVVKSLGLGFLILIGPPIGVAVLWKTFWSVIKRE